MNPEPAMDREPVGGGLPPTLSALLGMPVLGAGGEALGHVQDIRLIRDASSSAPWGPTAVATLIVDGRHAGSLLGYDRRSEQGPAALRLAIGWLHRRALLIDWADVDVVLGERGAALRLRAGRTGRPLRADRR